MKQTILLLFLAHLYITSALPSSPTTESSDYYDGSTENSTVPQDLYVIKSVVYEVGILTDAGNDTDALNETHEQVDLQFFDPTFNGSVVDLSKIPVPIQTNVSGVSVTGVLPASGLGALISNASAGAGVPPVPILPDKQLTLTQNISTSNPKEGSKIISNLPKVLGLTSNDTNTEKKS